MDTPRFLDPDHPTQSTNKRPIFYKKNLLTTVHCESPGREHGELPEKQSQIVKRSCPTVFLSRTKTNLRVNWGSERCVGFTSLTRPRWCQGTE